MSNPYPGACRLLRQGMASGGNLAQNDDNEVVVIPPKVATAKERAEMTGGDVPLLTHRTNPEHPIEFKFEYWTILAFLVGGLLLIGGMEVAYRIAVGSEPEPTPLFQER